MKIMGWDLMLEHWVLKSQFSSHKLSKYLFGMVVLLSFSAPLHALDLGLAKEDGGQAGSMFDFAASARSLGMGRAHTGVADDASAGYWNPAGLSQLDQRNFVALYSLLEQDTSFGAFSFAAPTVDYGTFGVGLVTLRSTNFEKRQSGSGILLGTYDQADTGLTLSHAFRLSPTVSLGESLKLANQKIDSESGTGTGADVGLLWQAHAKLQAGISIRNLWAPRIRLKTETETLARDVRAGVQVKPGQNFLLAMDVSKMEQRTPKIYTGAEWQIRDVIALRTGLNDTEVTAGVGFKFDEWSLDYAFGMQQAVGGVDALGNTHRLGFNLLFGNKVSETGVSMKWQRKGKLVLDLLREEMNSSDSPIPSEIERLVSAAQDVVVHQGFAKAQDLYAAQGYVAYFKGEYERSVQALTESLALDPHNKELKSHLVKAQSTLTDEQTRSVVVQELRVMKELYQKGDYAAAELAGQKILVLMPDHVEAAAYMDDISRRINEPIIRELKIAKTKMEREEYLDAIRHLQDVRALDPKNSEASLMMTAAIEALEKKSRAQATVKKPTVSKPQRSVFELTPDSAKSRQLYSQGLMMYSRGDLKEAVVTWEKAVKMDPENHLARSAFNRGQAELQETPSR
jgi:tetratricopeptide (TPR) repeat protein